MKLMGGEIKKFFLSFNRFNKPAVLAAVFFSVFLGLTLPFHFADAFLGALATAIGMAVAITVLNAVLQLILIVSNLFVGLAGVILNWVISPHFMSLPYTYGGIVDIGWPIVRDFINMFFIIALVVIGLATALRIKEYQAQKTLPLLIIIAILINFTPVICGVIIDASNILMNFFLEELTGFELLGNVFSTQWNMVWHALTHIYNPLEAFTLMGKALIMIIFAWVTAFIFFMFALLFIMRYVMIWVLVIVSPIAFFSRIFPGSQRYLFKSILGWDEWWKQFIEWSIIGVIAGFFLYLAEQLMTMAPGWIPGIPPGGAWGIITTPLVDFVNQLLPYGVVLAFLMIGFLVAISTSAMGATAITKLAKKSMTGMRKATAGLAREGIKQVPSLARGIGGRLGGRWERFAVEHSKMAARIAVPTRVAKWAGREVAKRIPEKVKTGAGYAGRGLQKAWGEIGKPIFKAGWEPFRKEIFGPRKGEKPGRPEIPERGPDETEEEYKARLEDIVGEAWEEREGPEPPTPAVTPKPRTPPTLPAAAPPPEEEEIKRTEKQIKQLKEQMEKEFKPRLDLPQLTEKELEKRQKENLERLEIELAELKEKTEAERKEAEEKEWIEKLPKKLKSKYASIENVKSEISELEKEGEAFKSEIEEARRLGRPTAGLETQRDTLIGDITELKRKVKEAEEKFVNLEIERREKEIDKLQDRINKLTDQKEDSDEKFEKAQLDGDLPKMNEIRGKIASAESQIGQLTTERDKTKGRRDELATRLSQFKKPKKPPEVPPEKGPPTPPPTTPSTPPPPRKPAPGGARRLTPEEVRRAKVEEQIRELEAKAIRRKSFSPEEAKELPRLYEERKRGKPPPSPTPTPTPILRREKAIYALEKELREKGATQEKIEERIDLYYQLKYQGVHQSEIDKRVRAGIPTPTPTGAVRPTPSIEPSPLTTEEKVEKKKESRRKRKPQKKSPPLEEEEGPRKKRKPQEEPPPLEEEE